MEALEPISLSENSRDKKWKQRKRLRIPEKYRQIIKYVILTLCLSGLIFQATQLTVQYLGRRTIVHLEFETIWYNRLPSITICYPNFVAMNKTVEKFPQFRKHFDEYKNILKKVSENDFKDSKLQRRLNDLYEGKFVNATKQLNLTFEQWSEISVPFEFPFNKSRFAPNVNVSAIDIVVSGLRRYENGTIHRTTVRDKKPIQSYVMNYADQMSKCFTFFSHLQKRIQGFQMDIKRILMTVRHHEDWYPATMYSKRGNEILFAMHSANTIPQNWDTFMLLNTGYNYEFRYNRWKTLLLEPPYTTGCRKYNIDSTIDYRLRSDCVNHCITDKIDQTCMKCDRKQNKSDCKKCFIRSDYLWRLETARLHQDVKRQLCHDFFPNFDQMTAQDECIADNQETISHDCETRCRPDCLNRHYNFDIFLKEPLSSDLKDSPSEWNVETKIYIGHSQLPDQITQHIEEMSFVNFAGTFGGLFGVWMGLSLFAILHYLLKLI